VAIDGTPADFLKLYQWSAPATAGDPGNWRLWGPGGAAAEGPGGGPEVPDIPPECPGVGRSRAGRGGGDGAGPAGRLGRQGREFLFHVGVPCRQPTYASRLGEKPTRIGSLHYFSASGVYLCRCHPTGRALAAHAGLRVAPGFSRHRVPAFDW
jgi:hypothetical protein